MISTNMFGEGGRLLLLGVVTLAVELILVPICYAIIIHSSVNWDFNLATFALCAPRLAAMFLLTLLFGPYRDSRFLGAFIVFYIVLLIVVFDRSEVWFAKDSVGISRAFFPYVAGFLGMTVAVAMRFQRQPR